MLQMQASACLFGSYCIPHRCFFVKEGKQPANPPEMADEVAPPWRMMVEERSAAGGAAANTCKHNVSA